MLNSYIDLLSNNQLLLLILVAIFSMCVGSFLNVVIYRLPLIMEKEMKNECEFFLHPDNPIIDESKFSLNHPRSKCTSCNNQLAWFHNIPVFSWLVLKGRCAFCLDRISIRYPAIEIGTMAISTFIVYKFGLTPEALFLLLFTWLLIPLFFIDIDHQLLPDRITFLIIGIGLAINSYSVFVTPEKSIWGAIIGFLCLWVVYITFKIITGKEGMGYGDFKLLAGFGAWFGPEILINTILISSILGTICGIYITIKKKSNGPFAFGPFLIIGAFASILMQI